MRAALETLLLGNDTSGIRDAEIRMTRVFGEPSKPVVLLGAGEVGRGALNVLRREKIEVLAFADSNPAKWGGTVEGLPIVSPAAAAAKHGASAVFLVTYKCDAATYEKEARRLEGFGAETVVPISVPMRRWPEIAGWPSEPPSWYADRASRVLAAYDLLSDDESRRHFLGHFRWRILRDWAALPSGEQADQYFRDEIVKLRDDEVFVDGGSFDGDSIRAFLWHRCERFGAVHAWEPDPRSYEALVAFVKKLPTEIGSKIKTLPYAVSDRDGEARFTALGSHSSFMGGAEATVVVKTAAIDEVTKGERISFLKLDLEGGEAPAIKGAEKSIRTHRPIIALAVYHRPHDLFELPLRLRELCDRYRFYLRAHNSYGLDVVLYAVPEERAIL